MQLLFEHSEEGNAAGLGIFKGEVRRFAHNLHDEQDHKLKVPHMGWNQVYREQNDAGPLHPMWKDIENGDRFYYVHSYYVDPVDKGLVSGYSIYPARFTSCVARDNIFAVQFHPEKSQHAGLQLLSNFVQWNGRF